MIGIEIDPKVGSLSFYFNGSKQEVQFEDPIFQNINEYLDEGKCLHPFALIEQTGTRINEKYSV